MIKPILLCGIMALTGLNISGQPGNKKSFDADFFKHSYISLMPEGEPRDLKVFLPLHPSVVAWGADPVNSGMNISRMGEKIASYKNEVGIKYIAINDWMLTATERYLYDHPDYQDAVCRDIEGNPIVPNWLDSEYKGVRPYWGCTNNPLFRKFLKEKAVIGIKSGANMLHFDDHMGTAAAAIHSGGCFCKYCMQGFNEWLKKNFTSRDLKEKGINDIQDFDYARMVKEAGFTTLTSYKTGISQNKVPLHNEFLAYQLYEAAELVKELGAVADSVAGMHIPVGVNSWNLDPSQLATAHYADYFANEVQQYDVEDLVPPFVYMLGNALGKSVFSTGTGEDWVKIKQHPDTTRIRRWIATAYACGQYFMYSYNKWGYSDKTGTQWYRIPVQTFEPMTSFITQNPGLFDGFEPITQVGVLYENEVCKNNHWSVRNICRELNYANVPVGLAVSGDDSWLKHELTPEALGKFEYLVLPEITNLSDKENQLLKRFSREGKLIKWTNKEDVVRKIPPLITVKNGDKVWTLPRINRDDKKIVIHLLNQDYDGQKDRMNQKTNVQIFISKKLTDNISFSGISLYAPGRKPVPLAINKTDGGVEVTVPAIEIWSVLKLE